MYKTINISIITNNMKTNEFILFKSSQDDVLNLFIYLLINIILYIYIFILLY